MREPVHPSLPLKRLGAVPDELAMLVETVTWDVARGWEPTLPCPDDRIALVLVFGAHPGGSSTGGSATGDNGALVNEAADSAMAEALSTLSARWDGHAVLGCSTPGQVGTSSEPALVVVVTRFEHTELRWCHVDVARAGGARLASREIAEHLAGDDLRGVLCIGDGEAINGAALAAGFAEHLPGVPLSGGLAGDGVAMERSWSLVDGARAAGQVSAVGFFGDHIELGFGAAGGWDVFGPERLITQSYGSVLYELDGKPALPLYREYLGGAAEELPGSAIGYPMAIRDLENRTVIRTIWGVNPATESLRFAGEVPQGSIAQLLRASPDRLINGAHAAASDATTGGEELAIVVSCVGRRMVLGERSSEEIDAALEALADDVQLVGFYSASSLAPAIGGSNVHNQTMAITTVREHSSPRFASLVPGDVGAERT